MRVNEFDSNILHDLRDHKVSAFNEIYKIYSKQLYIFLLDKLKDTEHCNDVLQDVFVTLWEKRTEIAIETSLKAYLFQSARFKVIDIYRRDLRYHKYLSELTEYIEFDQTIIDRIDNRKKLHDIEAAVNKLPTKMREIFILSRYQHYNTHDIASKTNLSTQTVKNQITKALRILRVNYTSVDMILMLLIFSPLLK